MAKRARSGAAAPAQSNEDPLTEWLLRAAPREAAILLARWRHHHRGADNTDGIAPQWPPDATLAAHPRIDSVLKRSPQLSAREAWADSNEGHAARQLWEASAHDKADVQVLKPPFLGDMAMVDRLTSLGVDPGERLLTWRDPAFPETGRDIRRRLLESGMTFGLIMECEAEGHLPRYQKRGAPKGKRSRAGDIDAGRNVRNSCTGAVLTGRDWATAYKKARDEQLQNMPATGGEPERKRRLRAAFSQACEEWLIDPDTGRVVIVE